MQSMSLPAQTITNSVSPYMFTNANTCTYTMYMYLTDHRMKDFNS